MSMYLVLTRTNSVSLKLLCVWIMNFRGIMKFRGIMNFRGLGIFLGVWFYKSI